MCRFKSCIILKDRVYVPDHDSHQKMLKELGISDTQQNAESLFVRAEVIPPDGFVFADMAEWCCVIDQDITPDWFVKGYDENRARDAVKQWIDEHTLTEKVSRVKSGVWFVDDENRVEAEGYAKVWAYDHAEVTAVGYSTVCAHGKSLVYAYDTSTVLAYDKARVRAEDRAIVDAKNESYVSASNNTVVYAYDESRVEAFGRANVIAADMSKVEAHADVSVIAHDYAYVDANGRCIVRANDESEIDAHDTTIVMVCDGSEATVNLTGHAVSAEKRGVGEKYEIRVAEGK